jgi:hypothetical protein
MPLAAIIFSESLGFLYPSLVTMPLTKSTPDGACATAQSRTALVRQRQRQCRFLRQIRAPDQPQDETTNRTR